MKNIYVSIGMIVKNEEQYLQECIESLKPLMDAISTELVIVDTGSTDKTVEIAKKYTDKIYFFDWVNDFSAAPTSLPMRTGSKKSALRRKLQSGFFRF